MSGGSLNYACHRVDDVANSVESRAETPLHRAFAAHLHKVATALHDLEWMWSDDTSPGDEEAAIRAVLHPTDELLQAVSDAVKAKAALQEALDRFAQNGAP